MTVSQEATKRVEEAKKVSEEVVAEVSRKTEEAVKEARKAEEVAMTASQEATKKAEEVKKASEKVVAEAIVKAEKAVEAAAEEDIPKIVIRRILASREFLVYSLIVLLVSVMAAVCISLGLSLLGR